MLEVRLLGQFEVRLDGRPIDLPTRPAQAMLAYRILHVGTRTRREQLAGLLWPDSDAANARNNVRQALWRLRAALGAAYLQTDKISIAFRPSVDDRLDVVALARTDLSASTTADLIDAVSVYTGELLPGFYDDWVGLERERLRAIFERKIRLLLERLLEQRWRDAAEWSERWLALGEVPEAAYRALMVAQCQLGGPASVTAVYRRCVESLRHEFDVEASEPTQLLYRQLARGQDLPISAAPHSDQRVSVPSRSHDERPQESKLPQPRDWEAKSSAGQPIFQAVAPGLPAEFPTLRTMVAQTTPLPHPATPFIGRAAELAEITGLLDDSTCRLLTLSGPGGIGKTRLALGVAAERLGNYPHGVWFVNLAPLNSAEGVVSAIADTFKISAFGVVDPKEALRNYLREKALLLVLDNFEHVLEAADLVADILATAPGVQVLATSRERLRLRAERVYEVGGLAFPVDAEGSDADSFDAVRMFAACVHHTHPQYMLEPTDTPAVAQICRLAAGMPLGIELVAAWAPTLPVATIAAELTAGLNLLETTMRDVPERHRSARAVFEHSWNLLTTEEQALFRKLALFRGGFTFQAAQQVGGAKLGTLARLVDKSLVRTERDGRYDVHKLLRQFAEEKLEADPGTEERTRERHSTFYLALLQQKDPELKGPQQLHALDELERAFENVRGACYWALQRGQWERLRKSLNTLTFFMSIRARQLDAITLLQHVLDAVAAAESSGEERPERQGLAVWALTLQSFYFGWLGQFDKHVSGLERSRAAVQQYGTPYEIAIHCLFYASTRADPEEARALYERSQAILREIGATWDVAFAIRSLGDFAFGRGETLEARRHYAEALALWRPAASSKAQRWHC